MESFDRFVADHRADLRRFSRATRGEHSVDDVINEAWILAAELSERFVISIDFAAPDFRSLLLRHLYQRLVRYTELHVRHGTRLDHALGDDDGAHPLTYRLTDAGDEPCAAAIAAQESENRPPDAPLTFSLAAAYVTLLRRFDNRMRAVANHLLISLSYAYRCCGEARWLVAHQHALAWMPADPAAAVRPWRKTRIDRAPMQLEFDFDIELPFPLSTHIATISPAPA